MRLIASLALMAPLLGWSVACLWIDGSGLVARALAGSMIAAAGLAVVFVPRLGLRRLWIACALLVLPVQAWWLALEPSNARDWQPEVARLPSATFEGELVTIENVRHLEYRSERDFDARWETRTIDLSKLTGVDMFLSYWGSPLIAHTIASWTFADAPPLAISIETRKEKGESYSAALGFFRQFELYYVVADERDVIGLRTSHRDERVFLYHLRTPIPVARALLIDYLQSVNQLAMQPRWYHAITHNCTTTIRRHAQHVAPRNPFSWKLLVNGYLDELGYARGTIDTSLPFDELRRRSDITERARAVGDAPDFSARIRDGLPGWGP